MTVGRRTLLSLLCVAILFLFACRTWGTVDGYKWAIKVPPKVTHIARNEMTFTVETTTLDGQPVEGISFFWAIEWVGLRGSSHKGSSFSEESIRVKGRHGTAYVRVFAYDQNDKLVEVASAPFEVE